MNNFSKYQIFLFTQNFKKHFVIEKNFIVYIIYWSFPEVFKKNLNIYQIRLLYVLATYILQSNNVFLKFASLLELYSFFFCDILNL